MTHCQICRRVAFHSLLLLFSGFQFVSAGSEPQASSEDHAPGRKLSAVASILFVGSSTLHDFEGTVMSQPFVLVLSSNTWSAEADVLANGMTTTHDGRDKNMRKMMETQKHPLLRGVVRNAAIPQVTTNVILSLRIRDRLMDLPVRISDWSETAEAVQFRAFWELSLKQYNLKPSSVLGVIRVGDKVRLEARVTATKAVPVTGGKNAGRLEMIQP